MHRAKVFKPGVKILMLVLGVCNPKGESNAYNGLYLRDSEIQRMVEQKSLHGLPVRTEHGNGDIGTIVSTFLRDDGSLQCLLALQNRDLHDQIAQGFVRDGVALELSLGYSVDIQQSQNKLQAVQKNVLEVSLVKKGARHGCHILAYQDQNQPVYVRNNCITPSYLHNFPDSCNTHPSNKTATEDTALDQFAAFVKYANNASSVS